MNFLFTALRLNLSAWPSAPVSAWCHVFLVASMICAMNIGFGFVGDWILSWTESMFLLGGSVGLFLVLVIVLSLRAAAVLPKPYILFEEEVLRLVALHSLETFAPYLDAKHEGMVSVGDDRMLMRLGLRKHGTLVFRARVVPLYTRTFEEKRAGSSICAVHVVVSLKGSASSSEVVLYEQEHDWAQGGLAKLIGALQLMMSYSGFPWYEEHPQAPQLSIQRGQVQHATCPPDTKVRLPRWSSEGLYQQSFQKVAFVWMCTGYFVTAQILLLPLFAFSYPGFSSSHWLWPRLLPFLVIAVLWQVVVYKLAPPLWATDLAKRPSQMPASELRLSEGRLMLSCGDMQVAYLKEKFSLHITRSPLCLGSQQRVQVEVSQPSGGEQPRSLRFAFDVLNDEEVALLPALAVSAPLCLAKDVQGWLWPALAHYAELHGEPLRWALTEV